MLWCPSILDEVGWSEGGFIDNERFVEEAGGEGKTVADWDADVNMECL